MQVRSGILVPALTVLLVGGCTSEPPAERPAVRSGALSNLPVEITLKQRSTSVVPGTGGSLSLTIDDITRNHVIVSLTGKDGDFVHGRTSLTPREFTVFTLEDEPYVLTLKELNKALVGEDFGTFVVSAGSTNLESEDARIERLIAPVGSLSDATFIRNGTDHNPREAAEHLRRKWQASADSITTAEGFVNRIATKSSWSGQPYRIRLADGTVVVAGDFLHERLRELERER